LNRLFCR